MCLLNWMDFNTVPAVYTGNEHEDDVANTKLYLQLLDDGKKQGFCPVLIMKDLDYNGSTFIYGGAENKQQYLNMTKRFISMIKNGPCFEVWQGRLIYQYFLEYADSKESMEEDLRYLNPPDTLSSDIYFHPEKYQEMYSLPITNDWIMGSDKSQRRWDFTYENCVFVLVTVNEPWELLAWIPFGGGNNCPDALYQLAVAKGLFDLFGAIPMYIGGCTLEYYFPNLLIEKDEVEKAARIITAFDQDLYDDFWSAAASIRGSHNLKLWWD